VPAGSDRFGGIRDHNVGRSDRSSPMSAHELPQTDIEAEKPDATFWNST